MVVFWQHVWSRTSTGSDAYPGVALVPRACCRSPCLGVDALPGMLLLLCVCEEGREGSLVPRPKLAFTASSIVISGGGLVNFVTQA